MYLTTYCANDPVYRPAFTSRVAEHLEVDEAHVSCDETSLQRRNTHFQFQFLIIPVLMIRVEGGESGLAAGQRAVPTVVWGTAGFHTMAQALCLEPGGVLERSLSKMLYVEGYSTEQFLPFSMSAFVSLSSSLCYYFSLSRLPLALSFCHSLSLSLFLIISLPFFLSYISSSLTRLRSLPISLPHSHNRSYHLCLTQREREGKAKAVQAVLKSSLSVSLPQIAILISWLEFLMVFDFLLFSRVRN